MRLSVINWTLVGKLFNLPVPQFPYVKNEHKDLLWRIKGGRKFLATPAMSLPLKTWAELVICSDQ